MAFPYARFVIYYRTGQTLIENREDGHSWNNAVKYEYICPSCWTRFPYYPEFEIEFCPHCLKNDLEAEVVRQSMITALGIQFDPFPLVDPETGNPIITSQGELFEPYQLQRF